MSPTDLYPHALAGEAMKGNLPVLHFPDVQSSGDGLALNGVGIFAGYGARSAVEA